MLVCSRKGLPDEVSTLSRTLDVCPIWAAIRTEAKPKESLATLEISAATAEAVAAEKASIVIWVISCGGVVWRPRFSQVAFLEKPQLRRRIGEGLQLLLILAAFFQVASDCLFSASDQSLYISRFPSKPTIAMFVRVPSSVSRAL